MPHRRQLLLAGLLTWSLVAVGAAQAAERRAFDRAAFEAAQAQGRPILVDVYADWCPTCRAQAPVIDEVVKAPAHADLVVFKLNFDKQKADWRRMGVRRQSTLIAFKGHNETGRLVAQTDRDAIAALVATTQR